MDSFIIGEATKSRRRPRSELTFRCVLGTVEDYTILSVVIFDCYPVFLELLHYILKDKKGFRLYDSHKPVVVSGARLFRHRCIRTVGFTFTGNVLGRWVVNTAKGQGISAWMGRP